MLINVKMPIINEQILKIYSVTCVKHEKSFITRAWVVIFFIYVPFYHDLSSISNNVKYIQNYTNFIQGESFYMKVLSVCDLL